MPGPGTLLHTDSVIQTIHSVVAARDSNFLTATYPPPKLDGDEEMCKLNKLSATTLAIATLAFATSQVKAADIVDTAVQAGSFKTLAAALGAADLVETLKGEGPFTVFAPTDEAFAKLPEEQLQELLKPENKATLQAILLYHVVEGKVGSDVVTTIPGAVTINGQRADVKVDEGKVFIDNAQVVTTDIECDNGVVHVIDSVILPSLDNLPTVATNAKQFNTLLAAAKAAGLVDALSGEGPLTVFAPTDEAFASLPEGTVESLLKPENKQQLIDILTYHVVEGRVYSDAALEAGKATTLQGGSISIGVKDDAAKVNDATLISTDIDASNGVIHVIDSVLLPASNQQSSVQPKQMIEHAIAKGSELYNAGHAKACGDVYSDTMQSILASERHGLSAHTVAKMQTALSNSQHTSCVNSRAWTLRKGLEVAYHEAR